LRESALVSEGPPGIVVVCTSEPTFAPDSDIDKPAITEVGVMFRLFAAAGFTVEVSAFGTAASEGLVASDSGRCPNGRSAQPGAENINESAAAAPTVPKMRLTIFVDNIGIPPI